MIEPIVIDMAPFRELVILGMPDTAQLRRDENTSDSAGGYTTTTTTQGSFSCRLEPLGGGSEQVIAERIGATRARKVTFPTGVALSEGDDLRINGQLYEVVEFAADDQPAYSVQQIAYLRRET